ncbi:sigma 54-interacting transcriptional regulator [Fimbriiglobus ruber]|uniref:Response regulator of zinc sigma-54-dependent two-component system n=1 Tax=Fimbriiglobus ruber TaxID=1908690 RepID=A0A225DUV3_9BACT|nr:sigma 54-interacting transcriptional regulator [Fimbriiglobus ruber]OWK45182.1 Response regulator of zinc sigma-54-dependent two-component system [Fimbriiglobus ruber]
MLARLVLETGDAVPTALDLSPAHPATLGRGRENAIVIRCDIVSRLHAKIYFDDNRWVIRDFGLNGTRVNGVRVNGAVDLDDGSVLQIGDVQFVFTVGTMTGPKTMMLPAVEAEVAAPASSGGAARRGTPPPLATAAVTRAETKVHELVYREMPGDTHEGEDPGDPGDADPDGDRLRVDELDALCRYMTAALAITERYDLIHHTLRTILNQTSARVVGYLGLDPSDPTPKVVHPEKSIVDGRLSRRLTARVRETRRATWLFEDGPDSDPGESLSAFTDAICLPLAGHDGAPFAALHVYRTGRIFAERDMRFLEAVAGFLAPSLDIHRARRKLEAENSRLRVVAPVADELIGDSAAIMNLRQTIARAAPQPVTVLIHGESGAGKELVAQALHRNGPRGHGPLVVVNCAAIAPTLLEAELFGYRKGAFSGADRDHPGLFEQADDGTLFLDEVGELSLESQAKLLRAIEGNSFRPVGGTRDVKVDVRVVAATHRDLEEEVRAGRFRRDLLFRLNVINLRVPPLREHPEDIPELARFFLERLSTQCRRAFRLTGSAVRKLQSFPWPGNVRQLRAVLESAAVLSEADVIDADALPLAGPAAPAAPADTPAPEPPADLPASLNIDDIETWAIRKALLQTAGNVSQASRLLGMSRDTLHTKLKKKGIGRDSILHPGDPNDSVLFTPRPGAARPKPAEVDSIHLGDH